MCPFCRNKSELCKAALASSMTFKHYCLHESYKRCEIFFINNIREGIIELRPPLSVKIPSDSGCMKKTPLL